MFLNDDLHEDVYMTPQPCFAQQPGQVCRLQKPIYDLKQAPRAWFKKLSKMITFFGFVFVLMI